MTRLLTSSFLAASLSLSAGAASAQSYCVQIVAWTAPNPMRCQEIGRDRMGRPIWLCC